MPLGIGRYSQHNKLTLEALDLDEEVALGVEYDVLFLGKRSVNTPTGDATLRTAKIVDQVYVEKYAPIGSSIHLKRLRMKVSDQCISLAQPPSRNKPAELTSVFHFHQITYIGTDIKHERAFVIVVKNLGLYDANIFLCDNKKLAKDLLKTCADAYQIRVSNNDSLRVRASSVGLEILHLDQPDDLQKDKALAGKQTSRDFVEDGGSSFLDQSGDRKALPADSAAKNALPLVGMSDDMSCHVQQYEHEHELLSFDDGHTCKNENSRSMGELGGIGGIPRKLDASGSFRSLSLTNVSSNEFTEFGEFQSHPPSVQAGGNSLLSKISVCGLPPPLPFPPLNSANRSSSVPGVNVPLFGGLLASQSPAPRFGQDLMPLASPVTPAEHEFGQFQNFFQDKPLSPEEDDDEFTSLATKRVIELPNHLQPKCCEASVLMPPRHEDTDESILDLKPKVIPIGSMSKKPYAIRVSEGQNLLQF